MNLDCKELIFVYRNLLEISAAVGSVFTTVFFIIGVGGIPLAIVATATSVLLSIVLLGRAFLLHSEPVSSIGAWREGYVSGEVNQITPDQNWAKSRTRRIDPAIQICAYSVRVISRP